MRRSVFGLALLLAACSTPPAAAPDASSGDGASPRGGEDGGTPAPDRATQPPSNDSGEGGADDGGSAPDPNQKFEVAVGEDACETDADCIKASCCHPKACVSVDKEPSCADVACTLDCQAGSMDCFGGCLCQDGKCAARLWMGSVDG